MDRITLRKMKSVYDAGQVVQYALVDGAQEIGLNAAIGKELKLTFTGTIHCVACGRKTKKSYSQGYCFPCSQSLPQTDLCSVRPERCHFRKGTCRDAEWGVAHCMIPHTIYLANASGIKVGITRTHQEMTRWIDQGATQAIPIARVQQRLDAGLVETILKEHYPDATNWRHMLKGEAETIDLEAERDEALGYLPFHVSFEELKDSPLQINFPVLAYPKVIKSFDLDKQPLVEGTLLGIKGQYWIMDQGVINIRSYTGYEVELALN